MKHRTYTFVPTTIVVALTFVLGLLVPPVEAQNPITYETTLKELGYSEAQLVGPISTHQYNFSLPAGWIPADGSYVALDLDYTVNAVVVDQGLATLELRLNDNLLHTARLEQQGPFTLQVSLPPSYLLTASSEYTNDLELILRVNDECKQALLASLTVRSSSRLHFKYQVGKPQVNLALYPKPLYQPQSFMPSTVRFILPDVPTSTELRAATMVAGRLGRLSYGDMKTSATLAAQAPTGAAIKEHVIVVAKPGAGSIIDQLDLPVPLRQRQLSLTSQMPAEVKAGDTISYSLHVTNDTFGSQSLAVSDQLPTGSELVQCISPWGTCSSSAPGTVRWNIGTLASRKTVSATVLVRLDPTATKGQTVEHTASLIDNRNVALNVDTLSAKVAETTSTELVTTPDLKPPYFFAQGNQGVPEGDGIIQATVSPWSPEHIAIVVTGLDDQALLRGAQALSAATRSPGMWGTWAIVAAAQAVPDTETATTDDMRISGLGYGNRTIRSLHSEAFNFYFDVVPGTKPSQDAFVALHISHGMATSSAQSADETKSTLELELNGIAVGSAVLDASNAADSWLAFPLPEIAIQDESNLLKVKAGIDMEDVCRYITSDRYWLTVYDDSYLHLPSGTARKVIPSLSTLPAPFSGDADSQDLLFILPEKPTATEIDGVLGLAYRIGSAASTSAFWPELILGSQPEVDSWAGYNVILVGRPSDNPYFAAVNDYLPQPFEPGTNEIRQEIDQVVYRLPIETSLGYIQETTSPWDIDRTLLAVTGTTIEGISWAFRSLTDGDLSWELQGNLALVRDKEVWSMDTRQLEPEVVVTVTILAQATVTPTATTTATAVSTATIEPSPTVDAAPTKTPVPTSNLMPTLTAAASMDHEQVSGSTRPAWLLPLLAVSVIVLVATVAAIIWRNRS